MCPNGPYAGTERVSSLPVAVLTAGEPKGCFTIRMQTL